MQCIIIIIIILPIDAMHVTAPTTSQVMKSPHNTSIMHPTACFSKVPTWQCCSVKPRWVPKPCRAENKMPYRNTICWAPKTYTKTHMRSVQSSLLDAPPSQPQLTVTLHAVAANLTAGCISLQPLTTALATQACVEHLPTTSASARLHGQVCLASQPAEPRSVRTAAALVALATAHKHITQPGSTLGQTCCIPHQLGSLVH
ncbi:hypothetical protein COO60DRAFT_801555 [Scenedesmus sp. NREL 46B-D3]|nr:hypothetical protein COO60DRAFT_801555 [Scenedesmus sp. NREL 46B-D3]